MFLQETVRTIVANFGDTPCDRTHHLPLSEGCGDELLEWQMSDL